MTTPGYDDNPIPLPWESFFEMQDPTDHILIDLAGHLAVWICECRSREDAEIRAFRHRAGIADDKPTPSPHGPQQFDGQPCEDCWEISAHLLEEDLGEVFTAFGRAAYHAGRQGLYQDVATTEVLVALSDLLRVKDSVNTLVGTLNRNQKTTGSDRSEP
jgi:hypothetical protein